MTNLNPNIVLITGVVLVVALIGSVLALTLHGSVSGADALKFLGGFVVLAGVIVSHALGVAAARSKG